MRSLRWAFILGVLLLIAPNAAAQRLPPQQSLGCPDCEPRPKNFWRASGELFVVWWIPWAVNYYIRDAEIAKVTPESWRNNINGDWV